MDTTISPRRTTDMSVNEQFAGSSAEFTKMRRASPATNTARLTSGSSVAVTTSHAPSTSSGSKPLGEGEPALVGPGPHLGPDFRSDHPDVGPGLEQRLDLAGGDPPGPHHHAPPAGHQQVHRISDQPSGTPFRDFPAGVPGVGRGFPRCLRDRPSAIAAGADW